MNPMIQQFLVTLFRWALTFVAGWLVKAGIFPAGEVEQYVAAGALALAVLIWSLWSRYKSRIHFLAALSAPEGTTEQDVKSAIKSKEVIPPSVMTPATVPPVSTGNTETFTKPKE